MTPLSVVIITFNEERNIRRCLESVKGVADETIVLDSFSSDATEKICKEYNVKFHKHSFDNYCDQKNRADELASNQLILSLDADEALDDELKKSILAIKQNKLHDGYTMNRLTNYCGKWIRHSGWYPDKKLRLFDKTKGKWTGPGLHERLEMKEGSSVGHLKGNILHYSFYTKKDHLKKVEKYSGIAAEEKIRSGKTSHAFIAYASAVLKFLKRYLLQLGFLDGSAGFQIACLSAYSDYLKHKKTLLLRREKI